VGAGLTDFDTGTRVKPYLTQIVSTILWRLNNKSAKVRQQAADLTSKLAVVIKQCGEDQLLSKLGVVLFEQLGEEYPDTLGRYVERLVSCDREGSTEGVFKVSSQPRLRLPMSWV
jgi:hypothetical protein